MPACYSDFRASLFGQNTSFDTPAQVAPCLGQDAALSLSCAGNGLLTVAEHSATPAEPSAALSGNSETSTEPSTGLSGTPETFTEPSAPISGNSETLTEPSAPLSGTSATAAEGNYELQITNYELIVFVETRRAASLQSALKFLNPYIYESSYQN
ncbi:MAG: hypothetical protein LBR08_01570 [Bacteroidales bacterium]|jgi:hypothetical protein|nr:hypothetical protein [Bacteroidales bacterium]